MIFNRLKKLFDKRLVEWDDCLVKSDKCFKFINIIISGEIILEELDLVIFNVFKELIDDIDEKYLNFIIEIFIILKSKFKGGDFVE